MNWTYIKEEKTEKNIVCLVMNGQIQIVSICYYFLQHFFHIEANSLGSFEKSKFIQICFLKKAKNWINYSFNWVKLILDCTESYMYCMNIIIVIS